MTSFRIFTYLGDGENYYGVVGRHYRLVGYDVPWFFLVSFIHALHFAPVVIVPQ